MARIEKNEQENDRDINRVIDMTNENSVAVATCIEEIAKQRQEIETLKAAASQIMEPTPIEETIEHIIEPMRRRLNRWSSRWLSRPIHHRMLLRKIRRKSTCVKQSLTVPYVVNHSCETGDSNDIVSAHI